MSLLTARASKYVSHDTKKKKGFTLMEMLIVVAIIAVLVAIAIPVFTTQLDKARAATDEANIRSGYAVVTATVLTDTPSDGTTYTLNADGTVTEGSTSQNAYTTQASNTNLDNGTANIAGQNVTWTKGQTITYTYNAEKNTVTINGSTGSSSSGQ
jgi:type IV pilus assembly protein PilA